MPADERVLRGTRCAGHPHVPPVATCDGCGRPLCLTCAVPVRGRVLGPECLEEVLEAGAPPGAPAPRGGWLSRTAGVCFALASSATVLPWTDFGPGSRLLGAWSRPPRWPMAVAVAAVLGLVLCGLPRLTRGAVLPPPSVLATVAALVVAGSLLAIADPPPFAGPALAPWVALVAGLGALASSSALALRRRRG